MQQFVCLPNCKPGHGFDYFAFKNKEPNSLQTAIFRNKCLRTGHIMHGQSTRLCIFTLLLKLGTSEILVIKNRKITVFQNLL